MKLLLLFSVLVIGALANGSSYEDYKVYRLIPENKNQLELLKDLWENDSYDFWLEPSVIKNNVDIMIPPNKLDKINKLLNENGLRKKVLIENVQKLIDKENMEIAGRSKTMDWKSYHTLEEFYAWMTKLEKENKGLVKVVVVGKTYEKRDIKALEITFKEGQPTVFIEAGIHAREWISPAATSYAVNEIIDSMQNSIFRNFNYIYVPFVNPDGYIYSWNWDRFWKKTRTPYNKIDSCFGADPNRNWDFKWNVDPNYPCSGTYPGPKPFSEVETKSLSEYLSKNVKAKKIDLYLSFHSYGQLLMYPWAYSPKPAPSAKFWEDVGRAAAKALEDMYGANFTVGSAYLIKGPTYGSSVDYIYAKYNTKMTFTYKLRDTGKYGFLLPSMYIEPSGKEVEAAIEEMLKKYSLLT